MIRVMVVADSGASMAAITGTLRAIVNVDIVGYGNGATPARALVEAARPDVVLVDQMCRAGLALERIREIADGVAEVAVVGLSGEEPEWVVAGLRAGARAVVPRGLPAGTLARILQDIAGGALAPAVPLAARTAA